MGLFSSKSKSSSTSVANEIVTAAEGNNPQPTTITATKDSDAFLENTGIVNRAYKSQQTFNVNRSTADAYTYSTNENSYNTTTRNSHNISTRYSNNIRKSNYNNRRYNDSFNRFHNSNNRTYSTTSNTSNTTVNRTTNDSNNTIGSTIFGRGSSAWNKNTLGAYAKVNSGNITYKVRDRGNLYINNLPPLFDSTFSANSGESNFEERNDDTRNMNSNDFRVAGVNESNPFNQTTGAKTTTNPTEQKSEPSTVSKYVLIAAALFAAYLMSGKKGKRSSISLGGSSLKSLGRSTGRGLAVR